MNRSRVLPLIAAGAAVAALVAAAGCGERKEQATGSGGTRSVDVILDFFPNADHVGLYAALSRGYFASSRSTSPYPRVGIVSVTLPVSLVTGHSPW